MTNFWQWVFIFSRNVWGKSRRRWLIPAKIHLCALTFQSCHNLITFTAVHLPILCTQFCLLFQHVLQQKKKNTCSVIILRCNVTCPRARQRQSYALLHPIRSAQFELSRLRAATCSFLTLAQYIQQIFRKRAQHLSVHVLVGTVSYMDWDETPFRHKSETVQWKIGTWKND
jgi:hypothetical protein